MNTITVISEKPYTFKKLVLGVLLRAKKILQEANFTSIEEVIGDTEKEKFISQKWTEFCTTIFNEPYRSEDFFNLYESEVREVIENFFVLVSEQTTRPSKNV